MRALLLAAGYGTRLCPLTDYRPKAMVEIAARPMIDYSLDWLRRHGVDHVAINLHHMPGPLRKHVGDGSSFGLSVTYSYEPELLRSAGALVPLRSFFSDSTPFIVLYGDVLTDIDLSLVIDKHERLEADATLVVTRTDEPTRCGVVEMNRAGRVSRLVEKPSFEDVRSEWVNGGVYVCSSSVLDAIPLDCPVPYDFAGDLFPRMISAGANVVGYPTEELVLDVGSHDRLAAAADAVKNRCLDSVGERMIC